MKSHSILLIVALFQIVLAVLCEDKESIRYFYYLTSYYIFIVGVLILHKLEKL